MEVWINDDYEHLETLLQKYKGIFSSILMQQLEISKKLVFQFQIRDACGKDMGLQSDRFIFRSQL